MFSAAFRGDSLTEEGAFWSMFYFLEEIQKLSHGQLDVSDILSATEPVSFNEKGHIDWSGPSSEIVGPADSSMTEIWKQAVDRYRQNGRPALKTFS